MALTGITYNLHPPFTYPTVVDLSAKQGYGFKLVLGLAVLCDSQGERPEGIILDATAPISGLEGGVNGACTPGMLVPGVTSATAVSGRGVEITVGADGRLESAGSSDVVIGHSDRAAAVGEGFGVYICNFYVK